MFVIFLDTHRLLNLEIEFSSLNSNFQFFWCHLIWSLVQTLNISEILLIKVTVQLLLNTFDDFFIVFHNPFIMDVQLPGFPLIIEVNLRQIHGRDSMKLSIV